MNPAMNHAKIILASASPRRRELFAYLGLPFEVVPGNIDETPRPGEKAAALVARLAKEKSRQVSRNFPEALIVAADTTVALELNSAGKDILEKPRDAAEAMSMLSRLSGRTHYVLTAIALFNEQRSVSRECVVTTRVTFRSLERHEMERYVATKEPLDKAGAYGIQCLGGVFVKAIEGSYSNVVGLPLVELQRELLASGMVKNFPFAVS